MSKKPQLTAAQLDDLTLQDGALFHTAKGKPAAAPVPLAPLADTHGHLTHFRSHSPAMTLARAMVAGVRLLVVPLDPTDDATNPCSVLDSLKRWRAEAEDLLPQLAEVGLTPPEFVNYETFNGLDLRFIAGSHPYGAAILPQHMDELATLLNNPLCVGVGEIGLDFGPWNELPADVQLKAFRAQLRVAHERGLPVELHLRDETDGSATTAHELAAQVLREEGVPEAGCDIHCFTSDPQVMAPFVELGCMVAFGGAATFTKSAEIRDAAARCPEDQLFSETDSPYMAPVPLRGQECEPAMVSFAAECVAEARADAGVARKEATYAALWRNARRFFSLA